MRCGLNETHVVCFSLQKDLSEQYELQYDEFGFRVDTEGNVFTHMDTCALSLFFFSH